jgi:anti-sigma regulatory factor (Ser/Thr protein kinase)
MKKLASMGSSGGSASDPGELSPASNEPVLSRRLDGGPQAPGAARAALAELDTKLDSTSSFKARTLVSEIVANSVLHAGTAEGDPIWLEAVPSEAKLRVEVVDEGSGFEPLLQQPHRDDPGGRGLFIIHQLADRWGVRDDGRCVWFELDRKPSKRPPEDPVRRLES